MARHLCGRWDYCPHKPACKVADNIYEGDGDGPHTLIQKRATKRRDVLIYPEEDDGV